MKTVIFFRRIVASFSKRKRCFSEQEKMEYIYSFPEPRSDFDRTLYQYKCTMKRWTWYQRIMVNVGATVTLVPYYLKLYNTKVKKKEFCDAIFFSDRISVDTIPMSVQRKYPNTKVLRLGENMILNWSDLKFIFENIVLRKVTPYYLLKLIFKLGMISYAIKSYNPKAIISYSEESFTTSLMTKYCEKQNIEYIGIQHGERLFELKLTFFRCSKYYLWDEYYIKLFSRMRCELSQFIIEQPQTLKFEKCSLLQTRKVDFTFYLQDETTETISRIYEYVKILQDKGATVKIRPHPQWTDLKLLNKFSYNIIQSCKEVDLVASLSGTCYAVGRCSTVLFQAYNVGIPVVIDDISDPNEFYELEQSCYILLNVPHVLLSNIGEII